MALTQPTFTHTAELNLWFTYGVNGSSFVLPVLDSQLTALTDTQLTDAINNIMSQINVVYPGFPIFCDITWTDNAGDSTRVTYSS